MIKLLTLFLLSLNLYSQESPSLLKDVQANNERTSHEITLLLTHLKGEVKNLKDFKKIYISLDRLNIDLKDVSNINSLFFFKSEFFKFFLDNPLLNSAKNFQVSSSHISNIQSKIKKDKIVYTPFSLFIINSILKDLSPYLENNFLNNHKNIPRRSTEMALKAKQLERVLKYLSPWIKEIDSSSPKSFNHLLTNLSIDFLFQLSLKTYIFKNHARHSPSLKTANTFLNLDEKLLKNTLIPLKPESSLSNIKDLKDEQQESKLQALQDIKEIKVDKFQGAEKNIDELMKKVDQEN